MKPLSWHSILMMIGCLFLFSCGETKNAVQVISKNFETEIEQQQNLRFTFNKDLYPDSLLQKWDSTNFIEFTPKVKGMFKWNSSSELVFSPAEGFSPGTEYTAEITKEVLKHGDKKFWLGKEKIVKFHTAPLRVMNSHVSWTRGKSMSNVMVQVDLEFNYEVKVTDASAKLQLSSGGTAVSFNTVNEGNGKTVSVQFAPLNELDQETPLNIDVTKGIPLSYGTYTSTDDTLIKTAIPSRFNLTVSGIVAQHSGTEGMITVNTSQPVMEENLKEMVKLEPAVDFEISSTDAGFIITSPNLKVEQAYELTISGKLEGAFGGKMKGDHTEQVLFGKLDPSIKFINNKGVYLSSQGFKNLALSIVNMPKVEVSVVKIYENNLEAFMKESRRYRYRGDDDEYGASVSESTEEVGDSVFHKVYETSKLPRQNAARILHLDFPDIIKDYKGVYAIYVRSTEEQWRSASKLLCLSDIGLIVKEEKDNIYVFANSIHEAKALPGVKISFISTTNQTMFSTTTNDEGVAVFKAADKKVAAFRTGMVTAKMGDEFSFVALNMSRIETSRFDVGGREINPTNLNAYIYAERNLYRPGETIHVSAVIRDEERNIPGEMPVKFKLNMPNGKEFATMRKILNDQGAAETSFNIPATALTGTYTLELYTGNDVLLRAYNFSIEEFMPDRIKLALTTSKPEYEPGDSIRANMQADNLFGTPAAGRNYECEFNMEKVVFTAKKYPDYSFAIQNEFQFSPELQKGKTNPKGYAEENFEVKRDIADAGLLEGNITATVFDETGRPVHRFEHFKVYTHKTFVGIKHMQEYVSTRTALPIGLIAVNKDGDLQSGVTADVVLIKKEWTTVIQQDGGSYRYVSQKQEKVISKRTIKINGENTAYYLTPELSGEYEVRVSLPGKDGYVSKTFYAWGWGDTQYTSFEVNNEGNVDIKADKDKYAVGDNVNLLFTTPFEGRMLVTVERDKMFKYYYINTKNKSASLSFKAEDINVPNVYVSATLFRPMTESEMPLTVAHGYKSIKVANPDNQVPVNITMVEKSRSKTRQTITVKTRPGASVTIAAVDEGILQVKDYKSPDPYQHFYQKVALSVNSYDIYPLLLPEIKSTKSSTGGDGSDQSSMRVNPMFVNRVKLVTYWSGILHANESGIVTYSIDIPQFSGDLRVMAVAYKDQGFGSSDKHMKIADPIVISTALPRFLSPKDEVIMPVSLSNTTPKEANATVTVSVKGPLSISETTQSVRIPANREGRAVFKIKADQAIGAASVNVAVKAFNETFTNETEIGIRPPASLQKISTGDMVKENSITEVNTNNNFIPGSYRGKLIVSKTPLMQFANKFTYLLRYPYGCVEQTTSAAFPQLYYRDMVKGLTGDDPGNSNAGYNVQQAILKLQSMQLSNGALSYWPGGGFESWWGSAYAAHFLIEAKKAGYEVNTNTIDRLMDYLKFRLNKKETETFYFNTNQHKEIAPEEVTYSLYVLALANQPQISTMNYYKGHMELLCLQSKYLLAAAYTLSGQAMQGKQIIPPAFSGEIPDKNTSGSFYSYLRDEALALNALLDIDPSNSQIAIMARHISEHMKTDPYMNTQETVWGLLAMGKMAHRAAGTNATATISADGKVLGTTSGESLAIDLKAYNNKSVKIQLKGQGNFYYFLETSGITADGSFKQEDSYMKVRRTFLDRKGNEISGTTFHQNDLIVVKLTIWGDYAGTINNVAITDMLPAGFEIENSRLNGLTKMKWAQEKEEENNNNGDGEYDNENDGENNQGNSKKADYIDVRDDRINIFTSVKQEKKEFYYMVRAVSPGVYQLGPVQADAMYDGTYHSYNGAGTITVTE